MTLMNAKEKMDTEIHIGKRREYGERIGFLAIAIKVYIFASICAISGKKNKMVLF